MLSLDGYVVHVILSMGFGKTAEIEVCLKCISINLEVFLIDRTPNLFLDYFSFH